MCVWRAVDGGYDGLFSFNCTYDSFTGTVVKGLFIRDNYTFMNVEEYTTSVSGVVPVGSVGVVVWDLYLGILDVAFEPSLSEG